MESEVKQDSFGSYLKNFRLQREMAIETVAARTKITVNCLLAMEANALDRLPPQAYLKSFIRAYASTVGADADVAINLYLTNLKRQAATRKRRLKRQAKIGVLRRLLLIMGLIASILLVVRYTDFFPESDPVANTASPNRTAPSATEHQSSQRYTDDEKKPAKLKLRVVALEQTWLKIIVDDQNVRAYDLKPEDRLELEGTDHFNLMIGDASGLQIFFNDEPVKIFGSSGQVVNLKLP
jgi:cytoskeletal protein RodZ